jgi:hypothetical protein
MVRALERLRTNIRTIQDRVLEQEGAPPQHKDYPS